MTNYRRNKIRKAIKNLNNAVNELGKVTQYNSNFVASLFVFDEEGDCTSEEYKEFCRDWVCGDTEICLINAEGLTDALKEERKQEQLQEVLDKNKIVSAEENKK